MTDLAQPLTPGQASKGAASAGRRAQSATEPVIIAESASMKRAVDLALRFAPLSLPVLLLGETGTGKEVLAQAIHRWSGRKGELVDVDCGALPHGMVVAELFGHRRGAFTTAVDSMPGLIEQASGGTLFLDELASLGVEAQSALLRVLETGEVRRVGDRTKHRLDIRLVAAMQDRQSPSKPEPQLRPDLYHRLAGTVIYLAPLRDRPEDLMPLARHFASMMGRAVSDSVVHVLIRHDWPGNIRELRHVIVRAVANSSEAGMLEPSAFIEALDQVEGRRALGAPSHESSFEGYHALVETCRRHLGRPEAIAAELGVSRATLFRRLRDLGLSLRGIAADQTKVV